MRKKQSQKQADTKLMLINYIKAEECRIAILDNGRLEELFSERASKVSHVGNIYKGKIINIEPSIQAAFVDFGLEKNGFLHISDLHPQYFMKSSAQSKERVGKKTPRRHRPPIQHCLNKGQEIICQVIKEGIGSKGPTLSTYISIPGRYLVMMPGMKKLGVSRKIEDDEVRQKVRQIVSELELPDDIGFIVRTAGINQTKRNLQRDLNYLKRLWKVVEHRINTVKAPAELYQESDLVIKTIRDVYSSDIDKIIVDDQEIARKAKDFIGIVMPRHQYKVKYDDANIPLFHKYGVEDQLGQINSRRISLPGGGFIIIDETEALVAIDVNSGKYRQQADAEQTALNINMQAGSEIARQLRLRDLGGMIVIDFIDMREERHKREVEKNFRDAMKDDKAKMKILRINQFGLLELTRQRMRPSLERSLFEDCPYCRGSGQIKTPESVSLDIMRLIQLALYNDNVHGVEVRVRAETFEYLQNRRRRAIVQMEEDTNKHVHILVGKEQKTDQVEIRCFDKRDREIPMESITREIKTMEKQAERRSSHSRRKKVKEQEVKPDEPENEIPDEMFTLDEATPLD